VFNGWNELELKNGLHRQQADPACKDKPASNTPHEKNQRMEQLSASVVFNRQH
jgi:hypothetical protein